MDLQALWYRSLGRHLDLTPNADGGFQRAMSQTYQHPTKQVSMRLGAGKAMSVVTENGATLMADIVPPRALPPSVVLHPGSWRTIPNWMADILQSPPGEPFLATVYGKSPARNGRMVLSTPDMVTFAGDQIWTVRMRPLRAALAAVAPLKGDAWKRLGDLSEARERDPAQAAFIDQQIDSLIAKQPRLEGLLEILPRPGSGEWQALMLVINVKLKAAKVSAAEEAGC